MPARMTRLLSYLALSVVDAKGGHLLSGYLSYRIEHLSIKESVKRRTKIYLVNTEGTVSEIHH